MFGPDCWRKRTCKLLGQGWTEAAALVKEGVNPAACAWAPM